MKRTRLQFFGIAVILAVVAAGVAGAQPLSFDNAGFSRIAPPGGIGLDTVLAVPLSDTAEAGSNAGFSLDLMAAGSSGGWVTGSPFLAGLLNMPFGLWSWINRDWLGGGITAGLAVGGITVAALAMTGDEPSVGMSLLGMGMYIASPIYGFIRGSGQARKMQAGSLAEALNDNPLNHINFVALPNGKGGVAGSFGYSLAW
jgi:F0F1-type ATP synthase membrane subunit c/vacuolar-type H+-ATPase subunit K